MGELVGVDMKTFIRLEADEIQAVNPRRTKILDKGCVSAITLLNQARRLIASPPRVLRLTFGGARVRARMLRIAERNRKGTAVVLQGTFEVRARGPEIP